jgi:hypothetical protein
MDLLLLDVRVDRGAAASENLAGGELELDLALVYYPSGLSQRLAVAVRPSSSLHPVEGVHGFDAAAG